MPLAEVSDATFDAHVLRAERPVVVDFWAPWCRPCRAIEPILEALAREHDGTVGFVRLNIDSSPQAGARFDVLSIPTTILFDRGEARSRVAGARTRTHYETAWAAWLGGS